MHIHLPKPLHGWREFIGEVGIIVVGVLIALTAEQALESWHWRERVEGAREALRGEIRGNYLQAVEWRIVEPCIAAQADRLVARLEKSGAINDPAPSFTDGGDATFVLRNPTRPYLSSAWQAVVSEGVSSHFDPGERLGFAIHFTHAAELDRLDKMLSDRGGALYSLSRPIALDPSTKLALFQALDSIRDTNRLMGVIAGHLVDHVANLELAPKLDEVRTFMDGPGTVAFCRSQGLPLRSLADAIKPSSR